MSGKTFQKDGETYIVSEDVVDLDTENLVDKDAVSKILDNVHNKVISLKEPTLPETKKVAIVFEFKIECESEHKTTVISGQLEECFIGEVAKYHMLTSKLEVFELLKIFHRKKSNSFILNSIVFIDNNVETKINNTDFKTVRKLSISTLEGNLVRCTMELS